jgi:hypothetical protein
MPSDILHNVAFVRTDVSEECSTSIIKVTRISETGTTLAVTSNRQTLQLLVTATVVPSSPILVTLMMEALHSFQMSVIAKAIWHNIPKDGILRTTVYIHVCVCV